ncbi:Metallo-peptidase family M12-domain-containing protein [Choanephora cucurbitarum]|nr:Metallo-peptidase family M12-domain-containing protein [Choanephora cucurbitarum]
MSALSFFAIDNVSLRKKCLLFVQISLLLVLLMNQAHALSMQPSRLTRIGTVSNPRIVFADQSGQKRDELKLDSILLEFSAFDQPIQLHLSYNMELFHPQAETTIFNSDGSKQATERLVAEDYAVYKGYVSPFTHQWARIVMRNDLMHDGAVVFEGAFSLGFDIYHIKTTNNYQLAKRHDDPTAPASSMIVFRDSDQIIEQNTLFKRHGKRSDIMCAMEELAYNRRNRGSHLAPTLSNTSSSFSDLWEKRDIPAFPSNMHAYQGCPVSKKIAYMGAAADCSYVLSYGSTRYAKLQMINDWNVASAVYERTFNVSLGLIYLQISVPECPSEPIQSLEWNRACSGGYTINNRLSDFSLWRGRKGEDGAALWHLMTRCATGAKVGIAWLSQLCETQVSQQIEDDGSYEWVSGTGVSSITRDEWKVVAHEVGHGFGAIHDCTASMCPCKEECNCCPLSDTVCSAGETYLMNPTSNVTTNDFSPCSISDICSTFPSIGYCLKSPDIRTGGSFSICGNGILEPGEECDSGLTDSECCHAKTCKLKSHAACDDYSNQCCLNCKIAPKSTVCRPAVSECDSTEYCTGESSQCPADQFSPDGSSCANDTMKCASGVCTSRDQQCMSRGLRQNISTQCSFQKDSCLISCTDPKDTENCLVLSGMFLDGTECGLAGYCQKGTCISTGTLNILKAWTAQNLSIAVPVYVFGSIAVLLIVGWIAWFIRRRYQRKAQLAEKEKDSRPNSIFSNDIMMTNRGTGPRRDSQVAPLPDYDTANDNHHGNANIPVSMLLVDTENNAQNLAATGSNVHTNHDGIPHESPGRINLFIPSVDGLDNTPSFTGTHRRGKSNV